MRRRKIDNYGRQRQLGRRGDRVEGKDGCKSHNQIQPEGNSHLRHWLQQFIIKFNSFLEYLGNSEHSIKEYDWFVFRRFSQSRHTWENLKNRKLYCQVGNHPRWSIVCFLITYYSVLSFCFKSWLGGFHTQSCVFTQRSKKCASKKLGLSSC